MKEMQLIPDKIEDLKCYTQIEYKIQSSLGISEEKRYHQWIDGNYYETDDQGDRIKQIGSIEAVKLLVSEVQNNNLSTFDLFDIDGDIMPLAEEFWDFGNHDFHKTILERYDFDLCNGSNILILNNIELIKEFRGFGLAKYFIKDLYNHFISDCALFIVNLSPDKTDEARRHKIVAYLNLMGFDLIPKFSNELLFMNPAETNESFKSIVLE